MKSIMKVQILFISLTGSIFQNQKIVFKLEHRYSMNLFEVEKLSGSNSQERPDIMVINETTKIATIVDFTVSFEGKEGKLEASREKKIAKYQERQAELEELGYKTTLNVIAVRSLVTWHSEK